MVSLTYLLWLVTVSLEPTNEYQPGATHNLPDSLQFPNAPAFRYSPFMRPCGLLRGEADAFAPATALTAFREEGDLW